MPEPNLPPLMISADSIEQIKRNLPEIPNYTRAQLNEYNFPIATTETLVVSIDGGNNDLKILIYSYYFNTFFFCSDTNSFIPYSDNLFTLITMRKQSEQ